MYYLFSSFFVGFVGFFPSQSELFRHGIVNTSSIALIMISLRNSFYAFENYGQDTKLAWMIMYGVSGLLIPASLSTALTITRRWLY